MPVFEVEPEVKENMKRLLMAEYKILSRSRVDLVWNSLEGIAQMMRGKRSSLLSEKRSTPLPVPEVQAYLYPLVASPLLLGIFFLAIYTSLFINNISILHRIRRASFRYCIPVCMYSIHKLPINKPDHPLNMCLY